MNPDTGTLYPSFDVAIAAGVTNPVELTGSTEDVERISTAVRAQWTREQKAKRNAANKVAAKSRHANRT